MSNINVCFAAFRRWQLPERKSGGRKSKVKKKRKKKIRHKLHASEVLPWSQSISVNTQRIRRPVYISLRKLFSVFVSYAPPLLLTAITWQYYTCIYISGVMVGVLYMSQYIKIFFYRWVLVVYWDWWFSVLSGLMLSVTYSQGKFASLVYIITTVK